MTILSDIPVKYIDPSGYEPKISTNDWLKQVSENRAEFSGGILYKLKKGLQEIVSKSPIVGIIEGVKGETLITKNELSEEEREISISSAVDSILGA